MVWSGLVRCDVVGLGKAVKAGLGAAWSDAAWRCKAVVAR